MIVLTIEPLVGTIRVELMSICYEQTALTVELSASEINLQRPENHLYRCLATQPVYA